MCRKGDGGKTAFFSEDTEITFAQLQEMVNRAGNALRELASRRSSACSASSSTRPPSWHLLGAIKIGAIPIPINTMMRRRTICTS